MPKINDQFILAMSEHAKDKYHSLESLVSKTGLTLFNILSPGMISKIDSEINSNYNILNESMSLVEISEFMFSFYKEDDRRFFDFIVDIIGSLRERKNTISCLQDKTMSEYFFTEGSTNFLYSNPVYVGIYVYIMLQL